jgi:hypothetical protein
MRRRIAHRKMYAQNHSEIAVLLLPAVRGPASLGAMSVHTSSHLLPDSCRASERNFGHASISRLDFRGFATTRPRTATSEHPSLRQKPLEEQEMDSPAKVCGIWDELFSADFRLDHAQRSIEAQGLSSRQICQNLACALTQQHPTFSFMR